ncbi:MAG TPA: AraC family transcriptional regulator [Nocardioides sp.]|nr:AraC family transcriptional regulator [Nocardioides sp.]
MATDFEQPATRTWDFPRHVAGTTLLVQEGVRAGVPSERLLGGTGLSARDVADPEREVTAAQELRVIRNLLAAAPRVTGAGVGARYHASTFGPLGFALLSSETLGDAANVALRFIDLSFTFTIPSATRDEQTGEVVVAVDDRGVPVDVRRFLVERDLAAIWTVLREITGGRAVAASVDLPFPPAASADYRAAFGVAPRWSAPGRATLRMAASWLDQPLPQANAHAHALAVRLCRDLVSPRRSRHGITEHVRVLVAQQLEDGAPMAQVAAALGLSERSLRRRLADAGTSYRTVVDEVRRAAAEELLGPGTLRVEDVAHRLGYAESTSFGAAYRRWTGHSPRAGRLSRPDPSPPGP